MASYDLDGNAVTSSCFVARLVTSERRRLSISPVQFPMVLGLVISKDGAFLSDKRQDNRAKFFLRDVLEDKLT